MPQAAAKTAVQQPPIPKTPTVTVPGADGKPISIPIPITQHDVDVLLARRSELGTQLNSAKSRRDELARQLRSARAGPDQAGIESRISQLDGRLMSIEQEMSDVGHALSAAPSGLQVTYSTAPPAQRGPLNSNQITGIAVVAILFVGAPLVISMAMIAMKRFGRPPVVPAIPKDMSDRLERMEQGIEAVALEVERIGEGQRFVTQLMSDRAQRAALPEGVRRS